jgi:hypothetical protein
MSQVFDDPGARHLLEMTARLAELDAEALDLADAEAFADERIDVHVAHGDLSPGLTRLQADVLDDLGGDERHRLARASALGVEMAVAFEPLSGNRCHLLDGPQLRLAGSPKMNRLDGHMPMMHQAPVEGS